MRNPTISGISGRAVVGWYLPRSAIAFDGFIYDGTALMMLNLPGSVEQLTSRGLRQRRIRHCLH
jgi:hypothetical protein